MSEITPEQRRSNIRLALMLGVIALLIACWPLYMLRHALAG
jgi:hypothetical protein